MNFFFYVCVRNPSAEFVLTRKFVWEDRIFPLLLVFLVRREIIENPSVRKHGSVIERSCVGVG